MVAVAVDLFDYQGRKYVAMIDRHSRYVFAQRLHDQSTTKLITILMTWFLEAGIPKRIETDGGPQFRDEFTRFCQTWSILHEKSSVSHHQSNGLAEAGIKVAKNLLAKSINREDFKYRLARRNATLSPDG